MATVLVYSLVALLTVLFVACCLAGLCSEDTWNSSSSPDSCSS
jgi:hypothetical protein